MTDTVRSDILRHAQPALDESLYPVDEEAMTFMKAQTGIEDEDELKKHVVTVQTEAYSVYPYPCIRRFSFVQFKLARLPAYQQFLDLGKNRKNPIFLDIGCCCKLQTVTRGKRITDHPIYQSVLTSGRQSSMDSRGGMPWDPTLLCSSEFWELGHKLFRSTPETFAVPFVPGDAFDTAFLEAVPPFNASADTPVPDLSTLKSLNPLRGHVSAIHASSFFHLFNEEKQFQLAQNVAGLLSAEPGSMILGAHGGRPVKGLRTELVRANSQGITMFCHSPESWTELWDGQIFPKGTVKVEAHLREVQRSDTAHHHGMQLAPGQPETKFYFLAWSVTRL